MSGTEKNTVGKGDSDCCEGAGEWVVFLNSMVRPQSEVMLQKA